VALAVSDVVATISPSSRRDHGGGPTTYADALAVLGRFGGTGSYPRTIFEALSEGIGGIRPDTPKPGSAELARAATLVVGAQRDALGERDARRCRAGTRSASSRFP